MKNKFEKIKNGPDKCASKEDNNFLDIEKNGRLVDTRFGNGEEHQDTMRTGNPIQQIWSNSGYIKTGNPVQGSWSNSGGDIEVIHDTIKTPNPIQGSLSSSSGGDIEVVHERAGHQSKDDKSPQRKLIIHLDIRNTILVADSVTNVSVEEALNSFLTGVVWGSVINGEWKWHSSLPSLKSPAPGLCTYYKHLEKTLVKNPTDRMNLRLQTGDFSHTILGEGFRKDFDTHLDRLTWNYQTEACHDKVLTMSGRDGKPYHYILPSVYKLLQHLTNEKREFAIIIRTYGRDAPNVLSSLRYGLQGNHPAFKKPFNINVCTHPGRINREQNKFELITYNQNDGDDVRVNLTYEDDIYQHLSASQGITGYIDDFLYWQKENYDHAAGKPMWIDLDDHKHHHIFFDDNFRADDEDSIIDVRIFNRNEPRTSRSLEHSELIDLEDVFLVQADLLESIKDDEYFIRKTELCEKNLAKMTTTNKL